MDHWIPLASLCEREQNVSRNHFGFLWRRLAAWDENLTDLCPKAAPCYAAQDLWPHLVGVHAVAARDSLNSLTFKRKGNAKEMQRDQSSFHSFPVPSFTRQIGAQRAQRDPKGMHILSYTIIIPVNNCKYLSSQPIIHHPSQPKIYCTSSVGFSGNDRRSTPLCVFPYERG
jgi:hypothetical protein